MTDKDIEKNMSEIESKSPDNELDVAAKSLTDALRFSFWILKFIMLILVGLFFASGIFRVQENEKAIVLTFGKIRGTGAEERILTSGLHWAWPAPIDEIVKIR